MVGGLEPVLRGRAGRYVTAHTTPTLPGSSVGLLGRQERVALAEGSLVLSPDGSGDLVVEAELT